MEIWKDVAGYEGYYEDSNDGNVRNSQTRRVLAPGTSQGYHYVVLCRNGERKNKQVNRLVAEAFIENPNGYPIVNHKNEIRKDNRVSNLEWCTYTYNNTYGSASIHRSESLKGRSPWNKGKKMTAEYRKRVSDGMKEYYSNRTTNIEIK